VRYAATLIILAALAGCGGDDEAGSSPVDTMEQARTAFLDEDAEAACALLTDHGREQALAFAEKDTCEANFRAEVVERTSTMRQQVEQAKFEVSRQEGDRATVKLTSGPYIDIDIDLVDTDDGWRIDDSEAVPSGD
jgi:hypothetical protein